MSGLMAQLRRRLALGDSAMPAPAVGVKACKFPTAKEKSAAIREFMREHGDDLPPDVLYKSTAVDKLGRWVTYCDEEKAIAAAMLYEHNDWYLCTLKNAAVRPDLRGKGLGSKLYADTAALANKNPSCKVLAADVTSTNEPSIKALKRVGFKTISQFCWAKGEKPADVMHFVKLPPMGGKCE